MCKPEWSSQCGKCERCVWISARPQHPSLTLPTPVNQAKFHLISFYHFHPRNTFIAFWLRKYIFNQRLKQISVLTHIVDKQRDHCWDPSCRWKESQKLAEICLPWGSSGLVCSRDFCSLSHREHALHSSCGLFLSAAVGPSLMASLCG